VKITLDKLHFSSWAQIHKTSFLWLKFTSSVNSKKYPKYTRRVTRGLSIFFFENVDSNIMNEFAILLFENVLKQLPKKILDE